MQEHIYKTTSWKLIRQTAFTFLFIVVQIISTIVIYKEGTDTSTLRNIVLFNVFFSIISLPSIVLTLNYLKHSLKKDFIVTYNSLRLVDRVTNEVIEIRTADIIRIELHTSITPNQFPWIFNEYFCLISGDNKVIYITSYIMSLVEFRLDNLTRRVCEKEYQSYKRLLPTVNKHS